MNEQFYTEKMRVKASFEKAAHSYDAAAVLQREVVARMLERLSLMKITPELVLDAGSGTGHAAPLLRQHFPKADLIELDLALNMLKASRDKDGAAKKWFSLFAKQTIAVCADIEQLPLASESVDVIWSSLTIQWCNTPDATFKEFARVLKPGGLVIFSTLGPDTLKELRTAFAGIDQYQHVNRFIDMHDVGDALVNSGLSTPVMDMEYITMTYADAKAVMQDLKNIGANNHMSGRRAGMLGKAAWAQVQTQYETLRSNGKLPCTYEVIYGHAWKPSKKPALADGAQIIEFRPRAA